MIETGDDWLLTKEDMPTLYKLKNEGLNFTNRYAPFFYAGYTINSEFAANTGYYLVDDFNDYLNNYYPYSLPNLFKKADYVVNSFHMNSGNFYNRDVLHNSLGYEHYYGNYNTQEYKDKGYNYANDISWIDNDETYNLLVPKTDKKFMSFLVTYSMHLPFFNNGMCEQAVRNEKIMYKPWEKKEEICLRYLAFQTDEMIRKLLKRLEEDKMLDDVVLVLFADHDAYGFSDKNYLSEVKGTNNIYLQQKTPLIIWSKDIKHEDIDILMDTADLVPTIANMFGLEYDSKFYLSTDVFSNNHDNYVYFSSGFTLDSDGNFIDNNSSNKGNEMINYNKYLLKTDYFRKANK
jgi:phosphoglycerol transferase MdoB-like AlkP superfamily enzyme